MTQIAIYEALNYEKVRFLPLGQRAETNHPSCYQIFECLNDEEFQKVVGPEEAKLLDQSRVKPARPGYPMQFSHSLLVNSFPCGHCVGL